MPTCRMSKQDDAGLKSLQTEALRSALYGDFPGWRLGRMVRGTKLERLVSYRSLTHTSRHRAIAAAPKGPHWRTSSSSVTLRASGRTRGLATKERQLDDAGSSKRADRHMCSTDC